MISILQIKHQKGVKYGTFNSVEKCLIVNFWVRCWKWHLLLLSRQFLSICMVWIPSKKNFAGLSQSLVEVENTTYLVFSAFKTSLWLLERIRKRDYLNPQQVKASEYPFVSRFVNMASMHVNFIIFSSGYSWLFSIEIQMITAFLCFSYNHHQFNNS